MGTNRHSLVKWTPSVGSPGVSDVSDDYFRTQGLFTVAPVWARQGFGDGETIVEPPVSSTLERNAPPSSYAVAAALDGEEGAIMRLLGLTALRGAFIFPGMWVVAKITKTELDTLKLLGLSFGGSATITLGMMGYYLIRRKFGTGDPR